MAEIIIGAIAATAAFGLYCSIRAGALEDKRMEALHGKEGQDADGESG